MNFAFENEFDNRRQILPISDLEEFDYPQFDDRFGVKFGTNQNPFLGSALDFRFSTEEDARRAAQMATAILGLVDGFLKDVYKDFKNTLNVTEGLDAKSAEDVLIEATNKAIELARRSLPDTPF